MGLHGAIILALALAFIFVFPNTCIQTEINEG
jgi:hypothetical protein